MAIATPGSTAATSFAGRVRRAPANPVATAATRSTRLGDVRPAIWVFSSRSTPSGMAADAQHANGDDRRHPARHDECAAPQQGRGCP